MRHTAVFLALTTLTTPLFAISTHELQNEISQLQEKTVALQAQLKSVQKQLDHQSKKHRHSAKPSAKQNRSSRHAKKPQQPVKSEAGEKSTSVHYRTSHVTAHIPVDSGSRERYFPTVLSADGRLITYIAGTPVVTSPYTGDRPAFDGSDYIVNISSINRDIRLMEQRRRVYNAFKNLGYTPPTTPVIALSGKLEPFANLNWPYVGHTFGDISLGSNELDVAVGLNDYVEAFMSVAFDDSPPELGGQRISNSSFDLGLGFVNIGNLDQSPFYFTAGQLFAPFGRYSTSMISSPMTMIMARTLTRPFILGYKSQGDSGPYAAGYAFISDIKTPHRGVGGFNMGYTIHSGEVTGDVGGGVIASLPDSGGMQFTGASAGTTFGGFSSRTNGSEFIQRVPGVNVHGNISFDRYSLTAEWVGAGRPFRPIDLSFNGQGARPQAAQLEGGVTFMVFNKPASVAMSYQWSQDTLALLLPKHRVSSVFNISIWKDTVESLEYRHDIDFPVGTFANGVSAPGFVNANNFGTGKSADALIAQLGVYF